MNVNIYETREKMINIIIKKSFSRENAEIIADSYWIAELEGKTSHGINRFLWDVQFLDPKKKPKIIFDKGAVCYINGSKSPGPLVANWACDLLIRKAEKYGVAIAGLKNMTQYGALAEWTKKIAKNNMVGIVINTCQPAAAPYGGVEKRLGTNPISIALPSDNYPIVLDMSTSIYPMSMIWESINTNSNLPPTVFYDKGGKYTKDPREAKAVKIFGGHKGFGLSFMFQVISGSLIGARMGEKIKDQYDIGYFFMAINPAFFQDINEFKSQNKELIKYIKSSKKEKKQEGIRIPGENSASNLNKVLKSNSIFINEQILKRLDELYLS